MNNRTIAFYPYSFDTNAYYGMIQEMISERYFVVDYRELRNGIVQLDDITDIYLNWIENKMTDQDRRLIVDARAHGIRVYWVFHNRLAHKRGVEKECRSNLIFLIRNVSDIIILSHASIQYLYEYDGDLQADKIHYLPHQNYIGNYGALEDKQLKKDIGQRKFAFACIGNIRSDKNIELVIKAFQQSAYCQECALFIVGKGESEHYIETLEQLVGDTENIFLIPGRIPEYMMNFYVQSADVILLPYDLQTCMNSGIMLLAFTNQRTVITANISMAEEFDDQLIYKYTYRNEEEHLCNLASQMEKAYTEGKEKVREKGRLLYQKILTDYSQEKVKKELYQIMEIFSSNYADTERKEYWGREYRDKVIWRMRYAIADAWLCDVLSGNRFIQRLKENEGERIAIYGYGEYGKRLLAAMQKTGLHIVCIIDQNADKIHERIPVCTLKDLREKLDIVIVTIAGADMKSIKARCRELNADCYVLNLKDI